MRASRISASYGARVAVAESMFLGGTCVNVGCAEKTVRLRFALCEEFEDAAAYGWRCTQRVSTEHAKRQ